MHRLQLFAHPDGRTVLHQGGFSWLAMLALPVWALHRGLRLLAALSLVALVLPGPLLLMAGLNAGWGLAAGWLLMLCYGCFAGAVHAAWLRRGGWTVVAEEPAPAPAPASGQAAP